MRHEATVWAGSTVLFNNAGIGTPPIPREELRSTVEIGRGDDPMARLLCDHRKLSAWMKAQTPARRPLINNGSISAHAPRPHSVAYTATKHAITGPDQVHVTRAGARTTSPAARSTFATRRPS